MHVQDVWSVLPHGPLTEIDDGILTVTGTIHMPLVDLERRMTVVRLADGASVIYSAMALEDAEMRRIEAFGPPRWLIVPGDAHRLDAKIFRQRYPGIRVIAPPGALERVQRAVEVDSTHADFADPDVIYATAAGTGRHEAVLKVRRASGTTLILNDLIGNLDRKEGFEGWLLHMLGLASGTPEIATFARMMMIENKARLRQQLLDWSEIADLKRILVSHGEPMERDPAGALHQLAMGLS